MSQCHQSSDGFIKGLFAPHVAVLCSQDAEIISQRNNLSFSELILPFSTVNTEIEVRDPNNQTYVIRDLHINLSDLRENPPDESAMQELLSAIVLEKSATLDSSQTFLVESDKYGVTVNTSCPWFDAYRETITSLSPVKLHEFVKHSVACMLVVSSSHPNAVDEFSKLSQLQNTIQHQSQQGRWMTPNTLKYYVLVHDNSHADIAKSHKVINDLQAMYGSNACQLLCINSQATGSQENLPDPWSRHLGLKASSKAVEVNGLSMEKAVGSDTDVASDLQWMAELKRSVRKSEKGYGCCLTLADHENLKEFMREFAAKGLVPHLEKTIRNCSEQIASRKAIHKSFFRATRSLFGSNKTASAPVLKSLPGGVESQELQARKLADLFFLCQMYEHAYYYYHNARKDFSNEQAWLHAAGASEMAAFSNFMQVRSQRNYPSHYVDSALDTYSSTCSDSYLSLRCALVSLECLRQKGMFAEAATQLLKLSKDEDDLRSAVLLEQIAHCFLRTKRPQLRKFAFHMVLAGHRYGKALQKSCALLCYQSAFQVYRGSGWSLAVDHINFTIGRHSFTLKQLELAAESFRSLLVDSRQVPSQQACFLNEFLSVSKRISDWSSTDVLQLKIPEIVMSQCRVNTLSDVGASDSDGNAKLLRAVLAVASKQKPNIPLSNPSHENKLYNGVLGEIIHIEICLRNNLDIPLQLYEISLVFGQNEQVSMDSSVLADKILDEKSDTVITFCLTASNAGLLDVVGISYRLAIARSFELQTNFTSVELPGKQVFPDSAIHLKINKPMPLLDLNVADFPQSISCGEMRSVDLTLSNAGKSSLHNLKVSFPGSQLCVITDAECSLNQVKVFFSQIGSQTKDACHVQDLPNPLQEIDSKLQLKLWLQGGPRNELSKISLLFYYEACTFESGSMFYRTLAYKNDITIARSLEIESQVLWDNSQNGAVVAVAVQNKSSKLLTIAALSCTSNTCWGLQPMGSGEVPVLPAGQDCKLCFVAKDGQLQVDTQLDVDFLQRINYLGPDTSPHSSPNNIKIHTVLKDGTVELWKPDPSQFRVSLEWHLQEDLTISGQHYIPLRDLGSMQCPLSRIGLSAPAPSSSQKLAALHQLVKWSLACAPSVDHSFQVSRLCTLPVDVTLHNLYDCRVEVRVDGLDTAHTQTNPLFLWSGKALSKFQLGPRGRITIRLHASFNMPGVYNLNCVSVWAVPTQLDGESPMLPQNCQFSSLVSVSDVS